jgi:hypothetical protein
MSLRFRFGRAGGPRRRLVFGAAVGVLAVSLPALSAPATTGQPTVAAQFSGFCPQHVKGAYYDYVVYGLRSTGDTYQVDTENERRQVAERLVPKLTYEGQGKKASAQARAIASPTGWTCFGSGDHGLASPFRVFTPSELGASAKVPVL